MSGTSLDGIDVVITDFSTATPCQLIAAQTFPFPPELKSELILLIKSIKCNLNKLGEIDIALGRLVAQSINQLIKTHHVNVSDITAIGSHGQTIFHSPTGQYPFSMQIGNANVIAEMTGITTVADFRQRDIAAGGQGAPLVPAFHHQLFADPRQHRAIINIGGISNITLLPADNKQPISGFDTGPGNVLIDGWISRHQQQDYDHQGQWAASGQCNDDLLALMLAEPYFQQTIPKSTGRELFNMAWLDKKLVEYNNELPAIDVQATLIQLTVQTIANDIQRYGNNSEAVFICGGGAHNDYLLSQLQLVLQDKKVATTKILGLDPDWVEACAFAWLADKTLNKQAGNLASVTGAKHPAVLGAIYSA